MSTIKKIFRPHNFVTVEAETYPNSLCSEDCKEDRIIMKLLDEGAKIKRYFHRDNLKGLENLISRDIYYLVMGEAFLCFENDGKSYQVYKESQIVADIWIDETEDVI